MIRNRPTSQISVIIALVVFTIFVLVYNTQSSESDDNFPFSEEYKTNVEVHETQILQKKEEEIPDYLINLRKKLPCVDKTYDFQIDRRGNFWVLKNYIKPKRQSFKCHETITYTTHVDFTFFDNVEPLIKRWQAPLSIAVYSPGTDFKIALESILHLRNCLNSSDLVREYVAFHFFFEREHVPNEIYKNFDAIESTFTCVVDPPHKTMTSNESYKAQKKLFYPINVGRNVAREAATTHFVLASDIELYPNPGLAQKFLEMYSKRSIFKFNEVFVLPIFEVPKNESVPETKSELQAKLKIHKAIPFHAKVCANCHKVPKSEEWMSTKSENEMMIFATSKRQGQFNHWEPIYIGTNHEPWYEEQLHWEGKSDKMTQGYTLCILDYDFHILSEGFLVHKPGIKTVAEAHRPKLEHEAVEKLKKIIIPQINAIYGTRQGCKA